jgi:hypothetical protein
LSERTQGIAWGVIVLMGGVGALILSIAVIDTIAHVLGILK